jgi:hypothetical protein
MGITSKFFSDFLEGTRVLFENLEKLPDFKTRILEFGYDDARLAEGRELRTKVEETFRLSLIAAEERNSQAKIVAQKLAVVMDEYMGYVTRLRAELAAEPELLALLGLYGRRDRAKSLVLEQVSRFFDVAANNADVFTKLQRFGVTVEKIQAANADIDAYKVELAEYERLKGVCQDLVEQRNAAFKPLRMWVTAFIASCKVAFADNKQALEQLGIFIRNRVRSASKPQEPEEEQQQQAEAPAEAT